MRKRQTTGLHGVAKSKTTIVEQACDKVKGFSELVQDLEKSITICLTPVANTQVAGFNIVFVHVYSACFWYLYF